MKVGTATATLLFADLLGGATLLSSPLAYLADQNIFG
jgi:hypothetical protein